MCRMAMSALRAGMAVAILGPALGGCDRDVPPTAPQLPLCLVEETPDKQIFEKIGKIVPVSAPEVLLVPYFYGYDRDRREYTRIAARPFVYRPVTPLELPHYKRGYELKGIVVVCPGYLPRGVPFSFYYTDTIDGLLCELVDMLKASNAQEANRVLTDFKQLLSLKEVKLGQTQAPARISRQQRMVYAITTDFYDRDAGISAFVWDYEHGTHISLDLTERERDTAIQFLNRSLIHEPIPGAAGGRNADGAKRRASSSLDLKKPASDIPRAESPTRERTKSGRKGTKHGER